MTEVAIKVAIKPFLKSGRIWAVTDDMRKA
jgi:hypothetical protein